MYPGNSNRPCTISQRIDQVLAEAAQHARRRAERKALLVDYITTAPAGSPRTHALMDGSASDAPVTKVDGLLTPRGALPARGLVTHDGIRGRDF